MDKHRHFDCPQGQTTLDAVVKRSVPAENAIVSPAAKRRKSDVPTRIEVDQYRGQDGRVSNKGKQAIDKHLLETLDAEDNPITNSDLYDRTAHVVTCATDVRQNIARSGSKYYISEKDYFADRHAKLGEQFRREGAGIREAHATSRDDGPGQLRESSGTEREKNETGRTSCSGRPADEPKQIFTGLTFYINGYTGPRISDLELKRTISAHGGNISLIDSSSCTHILINKNLSASRAQKLAKSAAGSKGGKKVKKVVHVDWVLDCVAQGTRLSENQYAISVTPSQSTLAIRPASAVEAISSVKPVARRSTGSQTRRADGAMTAEVCLGASDSGNTALRRKSAREMSA